MTFFNPFSSRITHQIDIANQKIIIKCTDQTYKLTLNSKRTGSKTLTIYIAINGDTEAITAYAWFK
jgi:hypothetical protein